MCVFFYLSVDDSGKPTGSQLTVDDLFQKDFQIHDPDAKWINSKYVKGFGKCFCCTFLQNLTYIQLQHFEVHYFPRYQTRVSVTVEHTVCKDRDYLSVVLKRQL